VRLESLVRLVHFVARLRNIADIDEATDLLLFR